MGTWFKRVRIATLVCGGLVGCTTPAAQTAPSVQPIINITPLPSQDTAATASALQEEAIPTPIPRQYTVQAGDTLSAIATRFGTTVNAIIALNIITDANAIRVGQALLIPGGPLPSASTNTPSAPLTNTNTLTTPEAGAP